MTDALPDGIWLESMQLGVPEHCAAERVRHRADTIFLILMGGRVIAMQSGFAMLEAAFVRPMNSCNIMMKNLVDMLAGCCVFYLFGHWICYGDPPTFIEERTFDWAAWFLEFSYATTAATIDSGALAGRVSFVPYIFLSCVVTGCIHPIVVRWVWGSGWLRSLGYIDFAGGSVVHLVGAVSAFVCICVCGPRIGRFPEYRGWQSVWRWIMCERNDDSFYRGPQTEVEKIVFKEVGEIHNPVQALFGVFLLLVGFLAFNPASTLATTLHEDNLAARISVTTLLATAAAACTCFVVAAVSRYSAVIKIPEFATMTIAGMVCSCGCCHVVPHLLMVPVGITAALSANWCQNFLARHHFDDAASVVAAHGPPGALGVLAVPLLARPHCQSNVTGLAFGGAEQAWEMLGVQVSGVLAIMVFTAITSYVTVVTLDLLLGFRSNRAVELIGHDLLEHSYAQGGAAGDPTTAEILRHSPVRDCLVERIVSRTRSGPASSEEPEGDKDSLATSQQVFDDIDSEVDVSTLQHELDLLKQEVQRMSILLQRSQVANALFPPER